MSDRSESPHSQLSVEDDEKNAFSDTDFIVLRHPLLDAQSLPSFSDLTGPPYSDSDLSSALDQISLSDHDSLTDSPSTSALSDKAGSYKSSTDHRPSSSGGASAPSPTASYEDASAFISRFISSPMKGNDAKLSLLRALIVELGLCSPDVSDLPSTLTSARKMLKAEANVNIKEYVAARDKGQSALRGILKPSKSALRKSIRKGDKVSLQWVKQRGLQVLLINCYT